MPEFLKNISLKVFKILFKSLKMEQKNKNGTVTQIFIEIHVVGSALLKFAL